MAAIRTMKRFDKQKEPAALISQNRRRDMYVERTKTTCPATVFSFPVGRGRLSLCIG
jgi:hypothetical protein